MEDGESVRGWPEVLSRLDRHGISGLQMPDVAGRVSCHSVFQACSISKHVAAFGALRLVGDGVLDLDADIEDYLTSWRLPASGQGRRPRVTLRQLLAHTAGLSYNWFRGYDAGEPVPSLLQTLRGEAPANTPPAMGYDVTGAPVPGGWRNGAGHGGRHLGRLPAVRAYRQQRRLRLLLVCLAVNRRGGGGRDGQLRRRRGDTR